MGGYFFRRGLLGITEGWIFKDKGKVGKAFRLNVGNLAASNVATFMGRTALTDRVVRNVKGFFGLR